MIMTIQEIINSLEKMKEEFGANAKVKAIEEGRVEIFPENGGWYTRKLNVL